MIAFHVHVRRQRARKALAGASLILGALIVGFFNLQLAESPVYAVGSWSHQARALRVEAPRGLILDRNGSPLADNVTAYVLSLLPVPDDTAVLTLTRLAPHLGITPDQVPELTDRLRRDPRRPLLLSRDTPRDLAELLEANPSRFPGVLIETRPERYYPGGAVTGHLVAGVEAAHDRRLAGAEGLRFIEVDQVGRLVGPLVHRLTRAPRAGETLTLTIDLELQRAVARLIPEGVRAGVVALAPSTGAVLAFYSSPGFDPNDLATARPTDRAMRGYQAGHLWQVVTAATGLRYGIVEPEARLPLPCRGGMRYGDRYLPCWDRNGHGALDLAGALRHSCDVYFYQLGLKIGLDRLVTEGSRMGFGAPTGIDVPGERAGSFPPVWPAGEPPATSEELGMRLAAGGAAVEVSPLRMAYFFATVASPGGVPAPRVVAPPPVMTGSPPVAGLRLDTNVREGLRKALRSSATSSSGRPAQPDGLDWSGKSGPAGAPGPDWFVGIAGPDGWPAEIVVAVVIEEPVPGLDAATVGRQAVELYRGQGARPTADGAGP
jgi:penicillin-binding protein 2